jgi:DNA-binding CsgD family transcriptional regulator
MKGAIHKKLNVTELTEGEVRLLDAMLEHGTRPKACATVGISERTGHNRLEQIRQKLGVHSTNEALELWRERRASAAA